MSGLDPISVSISLGAGSINTQSFKTPLIMVALSSGDYAITAVDAPGPASTNALRAAVRISSSVNCRGLAIGVSK